MTQLHTSCRLHTEIKFQNLKAIQTTPLTPKRKHGGDFSSWTSDNKKEEKFYPNKLFMKIVYQLSWFKRAFLYKVFLLKSDASRAY